MRIKQNICATNICDTSKALWWYAICKSTFLRILLQLTEAAARGVLCKKVFLEISQNSQENTCVRVSFLIKLQAISKNSQESTCARNSFLIKLQALGFIKKGSLAQVFSCEFCEILKKTFFIEHPLMTASNFVVKLNVIKSIHQVWLYISAVTV